jgi:hypothetical protein
MILTSQIQHGIADDRSGKSLPLSLPQLEKVIVKVVCLLQDRVELNAGCGSSGERLITSNTSASAASRSAPVPGWRAEVRRSCRLVLQSLAVAVPRPTSEHAWHAAGPGVAVMAMFHQAGQTVACRLPEGSHANPRRVLDQTSWGQKLRPRSRQPTCTPRDAVQRNSGAEVRCECPLQPTKTPKPPVRFRPNLATRPTLAKGRFSDGGRQAGQSFAEYISWGVLPSNAGASRSLASIPSSAAMSPSAAARSSGLSGTSSSSRVTDVIASTAIALAEALGRLNEHPTQAMRCGQVLQNALVQ